MLFRVEKRSDELDGHSLVGPFQVASAPHALSFGQKISDEANLQARGQVEENALAAKKVHKENAYEGQKRVDDH